MKNPSPKPAHPIATNFGPLVERDPSDLTPWPRNPRTHSDKQIFKLKASMRTFDFTVPVLTDEKGVILSGHGRVQAAKELGLPTIPTRVVSGWTQAKKRAYVLADNKLCLLSEWDPTLLKDAVELLIQEDFNIELTGFSTAEIDLMFEDPAADPDELQPEDIVEEAVTKLGDVWQCGNHLLLCGDALAAESYEVVMRGGQAGMAISDPPYNVPINGHVCGNGKVKHKEFAQASGEMSPVEFTAFLSRACTHMHAVAADGAIHFIFMDWRHTREIQDAAEPLFGPPRQLCVWVKDNAGMGTFYRSQHELVFVFKKGSAPHINNFELGQHGRYRTNVWTYPGANSFKGKGYDLLRLHPTVKPVGLIADAIRDCSHRKGVILDPFAGSGTVLLAAERTGRHARAIELDPQYVDLAVRRWQRLTGEQAVLAATGQTWDQVRAERLPSQLLEDDDDL